MCILCLLSSYGLVFCSPCCMSDQNGIIQLRGFSTVACYISFHSGCGMQDSMVSGCGHSISAPCCFSYCFISSLTADNFNIKYLSVCYISCTMPYSYQLIIHFTSIRWIQILRSYIRTRYPNQLCSQNFEKFLLYYYSLWIVSRYVLNFP